MAKRKYRQSFLRKQARQLETARTKFASLQRKEAREAIKAFTARQREAKTRFVSQLRLQGRASRARFTELQRQQRKEARHIVSVLKRKGILESIIDARKVVPSPALRRLRKKFAHVLAGKENTFKVPAADVERLKAEGYKIVGTGDNARIVLTKSQYSRGGKVFTKRSGGMAGTRVETIRLGKKFEAQIDAAFASLKPGDYVGFQIFGSNSHNIYQDATEMKRKLSSYEGIKKGDIRNITIFRVKKRDAEEWLAERKLQRIETEVNRKARRNARAAVTRAKARAKKPGSNKATHRTSRGH